METVLDALSGLEQCGLCSRLQRTSRHRPWRAAPHSAAAGADEFAGVGCAGNSRRLCPPLWPEPWPWRRSCLCRHRRPRAPRPRARSPPLFISAAAVIQHQSMAGFVIDAESSFGARVRGAAASTERVPQLRQHDPSPARCRLCPRKVFFLSAAVA